MELAIGVDPRFVTTLQFVYVLFRSSSMVVSSEYLGWDYRGICSFVHRRTYQCRYKGGESCETSVNVCMIRRFQSCC